MLAAPGDRRDEDIAEIGRMAAGRFDRYILRRDDSLRGRQPDEVPHLLRDALLAAGVPAEQILVIPDEQMAIDTALREAQPGDWCCVRRRDHPKLEADHPIPSRGRRLGWSSGRGRPRPEPAATPAAPLLLEDGRREFVRDTRGVWLAAGGGRRAVARA